MYLRIKVGNVQMFFFTWIYLKSYCRDSLCSLYNSSPTSSSLIKKKLW